MRIFISSPYRPRNGNTVEENKAFTNKCAAEVWKRGHIPIVPRYDWLYVDYDEDTAWILGLYICCLDIGLCDEVWTFGEMTDGMEFECAYARGIGVPVVDRTFEDGIKLPRRAE